MINIKETIKNVDWKSTGVGACAVLATEVAVYGAVKGVKAASKFIKNAVKMAKDARNEGLNEIHSAENNEEKKS